MANIFQLFSIIQLFVNFSILQLGKITTCGTLKSSIIFQLFFNYFSILPPAASTRPAQASRPGPAGEPGPVSEPRLRCPGPRPPPQTTQGRKGPRPRAAGRKPQSTQKAGRTVHLRHSRKPRSAGPFWFAVCIISLYENPQGAPAAPQSHSYVCVPTNWLIQGASKTAVHRHAKPDKV